MTQQTYGDYTDTSDADQNHVAPAAPVEPVQPQPVSPVQDINETDLSEKKVWDIPERPNWQVEFNCYISSDEFKQFQRQASGAKNRKARRSGSGAGDIDQFELAAIMIQEKSTAILYKGEKIADQDGDDLTLRSNEFVEFMQGTKAGGDVQTSAHAIEAFLTAGYMLQVGESIAAEAGFAGQAEPVNP